jgi:uncharacterized protein YbjT (DUF2867 family)
MEATNVGEKTLVLVVGATGTVGREAADAALAAGAHVRALVRSQTSAAKLAHGIEPVLGDLRDEASLARALRGVRAALYVSPHEADEEQLAQSFVRACEAHGTRLVFVGVHLDGKTRLTRALTRFVYGRMLPHYRAKFRLAERARMSRANAIMLMPTNFYQNDALFRADILGGSFPQPFERPVNRVDVRDLGVAAARALLDTSLAAGAYPVVGPRSLSGDQCAAAWTHALGREVHCERDPARLAQALSRALDGKKRADFAATYAVLRDFELKTDAKLLARTTTLLGRAPTSYEAYVEDSAQAWSSEQEGAQQRAAS